MKVTMLAIGTRMPAWVEQGVAEYSKRIQRELGYSVQSVAMARRGKSVSVQRCIEQEGEALLKALKPADYVIALDVGGKAVDTPGVARRLRTLRDSGEDLVLLVGGPDGLATACLERAREVWSLSAMTLPHALVRVLMTEQLYRAASLLAGHPYHRA